MKHPGWTTHEQFLLEILNGVTNYIFSEEFTKLEKGEKDIQQQVFYNLKLVLQFLVNPFEGANRHAAVKRHNKKVGTQPKKRPTK